MKIRSFAPYLVLASFSFLLFATNYKPGTFLIGWDSLHPELNFEEAFRRSLFSVWQQYRGLGLLDGMAHAANLPHTIFIWVLHFVLPLHMLRYTFIFLMHALGGVGMYLLLGKLIGRRSSFALLGALFYLLNLATIQMFFAPFEVFSVHFAFLPWLTFILLQYLKNPQKKTILAFSMLSLVSLPQAFVPQVFIAYLLQIVLILFGTLIQRGRVALPRVVTILCLIFSLNGPWLLPYLYHVSTNAPTVLNAKINQMASEDIYLRNKVRGTVWDVLFLKGFMLDVSEYDKNGEQSFIMDRWRKHIERPAFWVTASIFLTLFIIGLLSSLLRKEWALLPFGGSFLIAFCFLGSNIFGIASLHEFTRQAAPLVREGFRFPFTKFAVLFAFSYTIFFTAGLRFVTETTVKHIGRHQKLSKSIPLFVFLSMIFYAYPAFLGNFLFDALRLPLHYEYFETVDFFKAQDRGARIATFPQPSFWNWRFHSSGYRGSGFLWQGVTQPMLDRSFDPWSSKNENYYHELSYALYAKNKPLFEKVLEKYQVSWIVVDRNVIHPSSPHALFFDELTRFLTREDTFTLVETFGNITIYRVNQNQHRNFAFLAENLPTAGPAYRWNNYDPAYLSHGIYASFPTPTIYYPFRSLFSGRLQEEREFAVEERGSAVVLRGAAPLSLVDYSLVVPQEEETLNQVPLPEVVVKNGAVEAMLSKEPHALSSRIEPYREVSMKEEKMCLRAEKELKFLRLKTLNRDNCAVSFWLPVNNNIGYLIAIEHRNVVGKSLLFWLENTTIRKVDIETYLPKKTAWTTAYFVQPPMEKDGIGYSIHFESTALGAEQSVNDVGTITVTPIPYHFLTSLVFQRENSQGPATAKELDVNHPNPSLFIIQLPASLASRSGPAGGSTFNSLPRSPREAGRQAGQLSTTLVLSQAYDPGWKAFRVESGKWKVENWLNVAFPFFFGKELKDHVLVNNWANGWLLDNSQLFTFNSQLIVVYLPQYLQYLGFLMLPLPLLLLLKRRT